MNSLADAAAQASAAVAAAAASTASSSPSPTASTSRIASRLPRLSSSSSSSDSMPSLSHRDERPPRALSPIASPSRLPRSDQDTPVKRALLDSEKPEKRGSNLACLKCRAIKVKCSRANAEDDRCKRCNRLDLICEFKEHHRGRKPKKRLKVEGADEEYQLDDENDESVSPAPRSESSHQTPLAGPTIVSSQAPVAHLGGKPVESRTSTRFEPPLVRSAPVRKYEGDRLADQPEPPRLPSPQGPLHGRWYGPYIQPLLSHADEHSVSSSHSAPSPRRKSSIGHFTQPRPELPQPGSDHRTAPNSSRRGYSFEGTVHDRNIAPSWSTQNQTQRAQALQHYETLVASDVRDDAIRQNVISLDQAQELFDYFYAELNPPLAVLDSNLHTLEYCRQHLPILFSSIISVSSRFFRPHLHSKCLRISKSILNLAAIQEICSLDHIQALTLVITWRDSGDRTIIRKAARAICYAYELGLHASFDETGADSSSSSTDLAAPGSSSTGYKRERDSAQGFRSDAYRTRYQQRLNRDRQRTWIVLCLIQFLVRNDERHTHPRARMIPLEDHPDPYVWIQTAGDLLLSIDSRLAWCLDACLLIVELDPMMDTIRKSEDQAPFGSFFEHYRVRMGVVRRRYFDVVDGQYRPKFPMDKSAVAELPYIDAHRDFSICEATWHWAAKVAVSRNTRSGERQGLSRDYAGNSSDYLSIRSGYWFARTVESALRCLRIFLQNLVRPGYLRVGHDYLVISASQSAKWMWLYRDHLDATSITAVVQCLQEIARECSQPQRLPSGETANIEREAPGYLVRFIEALMDSGFSAAVDRTKAQIVAMHNSSSYGEDIPSQKRARADTYASSSPVRNRDRAMSSGYHDDRSVPRHHYDPSHTGNSAPRRPSYLSSLTSYRSGASSDRGASLVPSSGLGNSMGSGSGNVASSSATTTTSYERGHGGSPPHHALPGSGVGNAVGGGHVDSSLAPHPAYLASPNQGSSLLQSQSQTSQQTGAAAPNAAGTGTGGSTSSWSNHSAQAASDSVGMIGSWNSVLPPPSIEGANIASDLASSGMVGLTSLAANVIPLAADLGKHSLENLAANLGAHDLTYWQDILGTDIKALV
ncbi:hypothetical protein BCV70DRAFT_160417 [Testicularia cyperi]|uniref:Zn(2)-C6 fungal-type domain-containing protein n=1 Tax=Testicularia cyperi TaxID=1882483 RepID=A0A317XTM0_9BASI|nr:hypothetical protein BCV70DRAFT_160417 [Testicularia cyperi]